MTEPRALTPPEVRELLRIAAMEWFDVEAWQVMSGTYGCSYDVCTAVRGDSILRATLERYAELAEVFSGE